MDTNHPITEDDIANYLVNTPDFFERHAELLATVQLTSPYNGRSVSLQERQADMLRDKIKALELKTVDMIRYGHDNVAIADKLQRWARNIFLVRRPEDLPRSIATEIQTQFLVPQVAIKVWGVAEAHAHQPFAQGASGDVRVFAASLTLPYCGVNVSFEAANWLEDPSVAASVALIALRAGADPNAFGLLVLASPDPERFHNAMGTDFLERIGELAGAALSRLRG
ncbi:MAG: DUF484 family protein [Pseudomonadota bacterium]